MPRIVLRYNGATLATNGGVQHLYRQIVQAANQVCPDAEVRDLGANASVRQCREQAVARAYSKVNNSELAALYATSSKSSSKHS